MLIVLLLTAYSASFQLENKTILETSTAIEDSESGYRFLWDSSRSAWIIGDGTSNTGNAVIAGVTKCPATIIIPREFTYDGITAPVEVINQYAFRMCAYISSYKTRTVFVTKQVKVIQTYALSRLDYVTNFTIEDGSQLETIEQFGIYYVGYKTSDTSLTPNLTLPATLSSVAANGIYWCNLFTQIIYLGTYDLSKNHSVLTNTEITNADIEVRVTANYYYKSIFGYSPIREATEVQTYPFHSDTYYLNLIYSLINLPTNSFVEELQWNQNNVSKSACTLSIFAGVLRYPT